MFSFQSANLFALALAVFFSVTAFAQSPIDTVVEDVEAGTKTVIQATNERLDRVRKQIKRWDETVLGFRAMHNFGLSIGQMHGYFDVGRLQSLSNEKISTRSYVARIRYNFHLQIYRGFGYFLGTAAGFAVEKFGSDKLKRPTTYMLPGVVGGLVYNFNPALRALFGSEYYLERWNHLGSKVEGDQGTISVTARAFEGWLGVDYFYAMNWAATLSYHRRYVRYIRLRDSQGGPLDAEISRQDDQLQLGVAYHLF